LPTPSGVGYIQIAYGDVANIAPWAAPFVWFAFDNDIMQGAGGNFNPADNLTREQILAMVYRTMLKYEWVSSDFSSN